MRHRCWRVILGICEHCDPNRLRWTRLDKAHCFKKPQTLEREKRLVVSPEGTLIPSMLLPAHCIAWLCCHWCENHSTVTGISMCVCPSACSTHLVAGGGVGCNCVVFSQFFFLNVIIMLYSSPSIEPPVWTASERRCRRHASPGWKEQWAFFWTRHI